MRLTLLPASALIAALGALSPAARAEDFYQGKTVTILVGFSPGGGFDQNARLLARHLGRHIPGKPTVIVVNAPGAGSMTAILRLDVNEPKDGTVIDAFNFGLIDDSVLQPAKTKLDFRSYSFIGSISEDATVCYLWRDNGPKTIAAMKAGGHYRYGSAGVGTSDDINTKILRRIFGVDIQEVAGYAGSAEVRIAIEQGELDGDCGTWSSIPEDWTKSPKLNVVMRTAQHAPDDMPASVPYVLDSAPDEMSRKIIHFLDGDGELGRPYLVSHAVPADRVAILRQAFADAVRDPDFIADAKRLRLPVSPRTGEEATKIISDIYATPPDIVDAARKIVAE